MRVAVRDTDAIEKHTLIYPSLYIDCTQFEASQSPDNRKIVRRNIYGPHTTLHDAKPEPGQQLISF